MQGRWRGCNSKQRSHGHGGHLSKGLDGQPGTCVPGRGNNSLCKGPEKAARLCLRVGVAHVAGAKGAEGNCGARVHRELSWTEGVCGV